METIQIDNWKCHIFYYGNIRKCSIIYLGVSHNSEQLIKDITKEVLKLTKESFLLIAYEVEDWDACLTPWRVELENNNRIFQGNGKRTLEWLINQCIPYIEEYILQICKIQNHKILNKNSIKNQTKQYLAGYSLAGLFSLWAFYESKLFDGVASCSSSLWYPGWKEYMIEKDILKNSKIYFSLGEKEEKTRNPIMAQVGEMTRFQYKRIASYVKDKQRGNEINDNKMQTILEWQEGGHFHQVEQRIAKGIAWLLNSNFE